MKGEQKKVADWFDKTYTRWGFSYLRAQEAYNIFVTLLKPNREDTHLDVACGLGLMLRSMRNHDIKNLHGIDISSEAIKIARKYIPDAELRVGNAEFLPYPDEIFDSITCLGSLERMLERDKVLKEQIRVAKQSAKFCYMVRNSENFTWRYVLKPLGLANKKGHQDALNLNEWKDLFSSNGFKIEFIYPDHWLYYKILRVVLFWKKIDTSRVYKFPLSLNFAYEFIFVLRKA